MTITRRQVNGVASTGTLNATPPAWSSTPRPGSLLLIICHETAGTSGTWGTTPTGYTAFTSTPFQYASTNTSEYGIFWKIAGAAEATPTAWGETASTQDYVTYTYEFQAPFGWVASPPNQGQVSSLNNTAVTTASIGPSGALENGNQLVCVITGHDVTVTGLTFTNGFTIDRPGSSNDKLWFAWKETNSRDTQSSTASWTTSTPSGIRVATFRAVKYDLVTPSAMAGGFPNQAISAGC